MGCAASRIRTCVLTPIVESADRWEDDGGVCPCDVRILRFGAPRGVQRLRRHLWRMCFALFIAAGSFFSIRERVAKILPQPFTTGPMRALPIVLLFGAMFFWLWRVRRVERIAG